MAPRFTGPAFAELIKAGALFVINHSGGKDSQAMMIALLAMGVLPSQIVVVHASLGEVEWDGALELAQKQAADAGVPFIVAKAEKTLLSMVERRFETRPEVPSWPSASHRQCTSDLKRGPIQREIRRFAKANGKLLIVNCIGIRKAESVSRSKLKPWVYSEANSKAGREWYDWLPIFDMTTDGVFRTIVEAGQLPHPAYQLNVDTLKPEGNARLSCVFCIMGSPEDIANGAKHRPDLLERYVALEEKTGYTMHMSRKSLKQLVAEGENRRKG